MLPSAHKLLQLHVFFGAVSTSTLLASCASHNFIAAPQVTLFSSSVLKSLLCSVEAIEVHSTENSLVFSHQIVYLPLQYSDGAIHTIEFWVVPALNHAIILGMPFLYTLNSRIDWKTQETLPIQLHV